MTDRQRILAAIRGEVPDRIPFVPRLDFWCRARRYTNSFPSNLGSLSLMEIADSIGVGCYTTVPEFSHFDGEMMADHGLGIVRHNALPYNVVLEGIERRILSMGRETVVEYDTPFGTVRTAMGFTEEMLEAGCSSPNFTLHAIREAQDFESVGYIFSHVKVQSQFAGLLAAQNQIGERGVVVACTIGRACPMQHIMMDLMGPEKFFYAMQDYPERVERLAEQMEPFFQQVKSIAAESPAEVIMLGGNYDDSITYPAYFRKYILPPLREYAEVLHHKGKYLMTHTDGENRLLLPLYLDAGFDIADSVCPHPMTRCRLDQIHEAFADRITIWGGIPAILLCKDSASAEDFRSFIDATLKRYGHASHFVLGVSDMVTAEAEWDRLEYIAEKVNNLH